MLCSSLIDAIDWDRQDSWRNLHTFSFGRDWFLIPQRSESSKSIPMVPLPSEGGESKVR